MATFQKAKKETDLSSLPDYWKVGVSTWTLEYSNT